MKTFRQEISLDTVRRFQVVDITAQMEDAVRDSGIVDGFVLFCTPHATAAVMVNESEHRLQQDMENFLLGLASPSFPYRHDADTVDGRPNAWGHLMAMLMRSSAAVPVSGGAIEKGRWQSFFFVELDGPRSGRKVLVRVYGE